MPFAGQARAFLFLRVDEARPQLLNLALLANRLVQLHHQRGIGRSELLLGEVPFGSIEQGAGEPDESAFRRESRNGFDDYPPPGPIDAADPEFLAVAPGCGQAFEKFRLRAGGVVRMDVVLPCERGALLAYAEESLEGLVDEVVLVAWGGHPQIGGSIIGDGVEPGFALVVEARLLSAPDETNSGSIGQCDQRSKRGHFPTEPAKRSLYFRHVQDRKS